MPSLIHRVPGLVSAARRRLIEPGAPGANAHRYWRFRITAVDGGGSKRPTLNKLEWIGRPGCERLTGVAWDGNTQSGTTGAETTQTSDVFALTTTTAAGWQSNTNDTGFLSIDLGFGNDAEMSGVIVWPVRRTEILNGTDTNRAHPTAWTVEWSDDNSAWTTAWTGGHSGWLDFTPHVSDNPSYAGPTDFVIPYAADVDFWLDAANSFSDTGTTPCVNGDPVRQISNPGAGADFGQATLANRPIFRTGGLNGRPYLDCDRGSGPHFLEDIAWVHGSGTANFTGVLFGALIEASAPPDGTTFYALTGSPATNGGKSAMYLRNAANEQLHFFNAGHRYFNMVTPNAITASRPASTGAPNSAFLQCDLDTNAYQYNGNVNPGSYTTTAIAATQLLRSTGIASDSGYFQGRVYELLIYDTPSEGAMTLLAAHRLQRYFIHKYGTP